MPLIFHSLFQSTRPFAFMPCQSISCGIDWLWTCSAMADLEPLSKSNRIAMFLLSYTKRTQSFAYIFTRARFAFHRVHVAGDRICWKSFLGCIKRAQRVWCEKCAPSTSCAGNAAHFLIQTINKRNANSHWAWFVRYLFLSLSADLVVCCLI